MSIRLFNNSDKEFSFTLTEHPITNVRESPTPTGVKIEELDPTKSNYRQKKEEILNHLYYSPTSIVMLRMGVNDFENEEWAEYIYQTLGNPEEGGVIPIGSGSFEKVKNNNFVIEVDENGKEIKDHLWKKYRRPAGVQIHKEIDSSLFKLQKE